MSTELSAAATLTNGQVLFAGGEQLGRSANAELYNPATYTFAQTADMTWRRVWHTLSSLPNGTVLAAGGETDSCSGNACYLCWECRQRRTVRSVGRRVCPNRQHGDRSLDAYGHASW